MFGINGDFCERARSQFEDGAKQDFAHACAKSTNKGNIGIIVSTISGPLGLCFGYFCRVSFIRSFLLFIL